VLVVQFGQRNTATMKKDPKKPKRDVKLILHKESIRRLPGSALGHVAGGGGGALHGAATVTFPRCCLTR
jgi:hypothetical protein